MTTTLAPGIDRSLRVDDRADETTVMKLGLRGGWQ